MQNRKHVDLRIPDEMVCMVVGCGRRALFKNPFSARGGSKRGYCRKHKPFAVSDRSQSVEGRDLDWMADDNAWRKAR